MVNDSGMAVSTRSYGSKGLLVRLLDSSGLGEERPQVLDGLTSRRPKRQRCLGGVKL